MPARLRRSSSKFPKKQRLFRSIAGITIVEMVAVIGIITALGTMVVLAVRDVNNKANVTTAGYTQKYLQTGVQLYRADMGFYPPDVVRGWDPGLIKKLPWNPDIDAGDTVPAPYNVAGTKWTDLPCGTDVACTAIINVRWKGPYISQWPRYTPWRGKYDYNYWASNTTRYGCAVPKGVYTGVQKDYTNSTGGISAEGEALMIQEGFDNEQCVNGESQMLLWRL